MPPDALLDDRKVTILKAIIKTYLEVGEPVGSRTISKYSDPKLSSATIRSKVSGLERMGYIVRPHTSAGRIPSDKGYWFYTDQTMLDKESGVARFKEMMVQKVGKLELVLKKMTRVLTASTSYAITVSSPSYHKTKLKLIQLSKMEKHKLLMVVVVEGNIIKNAIVDIENNLSDEELLNLSILPNSSLSGLTIEEINLDIISKLKGDTGNHSQVVDLVLSEVTEAIEAVEEDLQTYTSGATNIFKYPELSDDDEASRLIDTPEHKEVLQEFVGKVNFRTEEETGTQIYADDKSPMWSIESCSVVITNCDLGGGLWGTIGIIGPKRMDYEKVLETLRNLVNQLDTAFKKDER